MSITAEYTAYYATFNSLLVLGFIAVVSGLWPVGHTAHQSLDCASYQVIFQVRCTSATIAIGSNARYLTPVVIVLICNAACFLSTRWSLRKLKEPLTDSLFFSRGAKHLYVHDRHTYQGVYYLDRSFGVLTGLLAAFPRSLVPI
ncbi:hypothetical protein SPRG_05850 [Saprolegnia parasitica CBS 223.65]|uniref:Uncharacterized protein n=1 Tax=Saprolegnia parasitica (strain CBS 223.65) TaxID=695850 RepID=A0A067CFQ1_SAPPC|nr:hypothetical protein SPRG_05850 [Saprolegnia parasitica CBS 223.65]KDO29313.1 hypothetical protein SPRG_05850 [Saprolegnia parasitica CBS 223.65]|eukprot:XP_012199820.1 hypothetical protein SPRG_05850 [Saprolegnia parasitica CBS 223.65]